MKKIMVVLCVLLCIAAIHLKALFTIARLVSSRVLQAAAAGIIAAVLWFAFVRKINKKRGTK